MEIYHLCFSIVLLSTVIGVNLADYSAEDCKTLGFNKASLLCSTCNKFVEFDLEEIFDQCKECCLKDDSSTKRYRKAALEVCECKHGAYPQIQAFIKSELPKKYKNLQIRHVRGLDPIIKLYDEENKLAEVLDINKWDTDSVDEFLDTHLLKD